MSFQESPLSPGLYLVATPIGSARDITLRALDILASADVLAAEDTRNLRHLMAIHGIPLKDRQVIAYHDHNGAQQRPRLLRFLADGKSLAYASDAGTPLVADPGYALVRDALAQGIAVTSAPGPSAAIAALTISGLPTDRFHFAGFAPSGAGPRRRFLGDLAGIDATVVLYESPKRIDKLVAACLDVLGPDRDVAICRELTKKFEEVRRGRLGEVEDWMSDMPRKGELVVLIGRGSRETTAEDLNDALEAALATSSVKDAAREVSEALGLPRRDVYQAALVLSKER